MRRLCEHTRNGNGSTQPHYPVSCSFDTYTPCSNTAWECCVPVTFKEADGSERAYLSVLSLGGKWKGLPCHYTIQSRGGLHN